MLFIVCLQCIYKGLSRDVCQTCMEKMAPGTFLVREVTNSEDDSLVISFRYVRTYVCMYVRMYVCMYVCTYVCMYVCLYVM